MKKPRPIKKIGRKRRTLGWMLLTLGLLVAGVWFASRWWSIGVISKNWEFGLFAGQAYVALGSEPLPGPSRGFEYGRVEDEQRRWVWWYGWGYDIHEHDNYGLCWRLVLRPPGQYLLLSGVALWPIPLLLWTPAALLLRSGIVARRRANTGACPKCGYSLAGLAADAPCPECGKGAGTT